MTALTYYRASNPNISFHIVANEYIEALTKLGVQVDVQEISTITITANTTKNDIAIVHPLFFSRDWNGIDFDGVMNILSKRHSSIYGMEVADSTKISKKYAEWADHPNVKGIMLPSSFSMESYRQSGVTKPLEVIPHGIKYYKPSLKFNFLKNEEKPVFLTYVLEEGFRKGWDIVLELIGEFPDCTFVIKGPPKEGGDEIEKHENVYVINRWLSNEDVASLYCNSSLYLSLHRGGSFELNCLEAICYGLPVVATGYGCVLDYLNSDNAHLVRVKEMVQMAHKGYDHSGMGATADSDDAVVKVRSVTQNLEVESRKARLEGKKLLEEYTWENGAKKILEFINPSS